MGGAVGLSTGQGSPPQDRACAWPVAGGPVALALLKPIYAQQWHKPILNMSPQTLQRASSALVLLAFCSLLISASAEATTLTVQIKMSLTKALSLRGVQFMDTVVFSQSCQDGLARALQVSNAFM